MKCQYCGANVRLGPDWIQHGQECEHKQLILVGAKVTVDGVEVEGKIEEMEIKESKPKKKSKKK